MTQHSAHFILPNEAHTVTVLPSFVVFCTAHEMNDQSLEFLLFVVFSDINTSAINTVSLVKKRYSTPVLCSRINR